MSRHRFMAACDGNLMVLFIHNDTDRQTDKVTVHAVRYVHADHVTFDILL